MPRRRYPADTVNKDPNVSVCYSTSLGGFLLGVLVISLGAYFGVQLLNISPQVGMALAIIASMLWLRLLVRAAQDETYQDQARRRIIEFRAQEERQAMEINRQQQEKLEERRQQEKARQRLISSPCPKTGKPHEWRQYFEPNFTRGGIEIAPVPNGYFCASCLTRRPQQ